MDEGRRIGLHFKDANVTRYYDIDPDGRVYWLRLGGAGNNKVTRYRVFEPELASRIKTIAKQTAAGNDVASNSSKETLQAQPSEPDDAE